MAFVRAHANDLRIGLYIKIAGSWFSHPFPANTFKIQSQKELNILHSLRNTKILYDPDLSDPDPTLSTTPEEEGERVGTQGDKARSPGSLFKTVRLIDMTLDTQDWKRGHWVWLANSPDPTTCTGRGHSSPPTRGLTVKNL